LRCRYYKRIDVPELATLKLILETSRLKWQHANNTLVVSYGKPPEVRAAEAAEKRSLASIKAQPIGPAGEQDCKQQ
jgi:protein DPCD